MAHTNEDKMKISLFGKGFIGGKFAETYPEKTVVVDRGAKYAPTDNILYMRSTIHNYHPKEGDLFTDIDTNLFHFMEVLEANEGRDITFNLISTWFVYGNTQFPANEEESYCDPRGFYSITARAREQLLVSYAETFGMKYRILRLGNVIGVGDQKVSPKKNALQWMIRELANGQEIFLYEQESIRDYIDVRDCVRAIDLVLKKGDLNAVYNVSNGKGLRISDLINAAWTENKFKGKVSKKKVPVFHKVVQVPTMWMDTRKLNKLGYVQEHDIKNTVKELVHHYANKG